MIFQGFLDFRQPTSGGDGGLTQSQVNIIEQNLGTQIDVPVGYTEVEWANGVPVNIKKYVSSDKAIMVYNISIVWASGNPAQITSENLDEGITTVTTITWTDGVPTSVNKESV